MMINLDGKVFTALSNSDNGEVGESTRFYYHQKDEIIWADYSGDEIIRGHLLGKQLKDGSFDFVYHHINTEGKAKLGKCLSVALLLEDGKIKLVEKWQWLCDDMSKGESVLIEVM
jgi:hypothetical protein